MLDALYVGARTTFFNLIRSYIGERIPIVTMGAKGFFWYLRTGSGTALQCEAWSVGLYLVQSNCVHGLAAWNWT